MTRFPFALAVLAAGALSGCARSGRGGDAAAAPSRPPRYLALGDSFTIGTGATPVQAYPSRFVSRQGCPVELRNAAVNGYTSQDVIDAELPELATFAPTFVTLAIGANDIVRGATTDDYRARVRRILAAIGAAGVRDIVAIPQPDWSLSPVARSFGAPAAIHARIVELNAVLRDETLAVGGRFIDLFPRMETQAEAKMVSGDGLHPNAAAYDAWAEDLATRVSLCASKP